MEAQKEVAEFSFLWRDRWREQEQSDTGGSARCQHEVAPRAQAEGHFNQVGYALSRVEYSVADAYIGMKRVHRDDGSQEFT